MPMELVTQLPYAHPYRWDGTLFGGPKLWRPTELAGSLALWLDAEDAASITLNGATVSQWNDKSGNGRNAVQATSANQPTYTANVLSGKPIVNFGADDTMVTSSFDIGTTSSIFAIIRPNGLGGFNRDYVTSGGESNSSAHILFHEWVTANSLALFSGVVLRPINVLTVNVWSICGGITNGANSQIRHNGSSVATGNAGAQNWVGGVRLGRSAETATIYADAAYAEVIICPAAVSIPVREQIEGYLAWKWGLQANLPANHPYKLLPPTV